MHFRQRPPPASEERILPLINVVFLLLIFFMLAGTLSIREPFAVSPPLSASQTPASPEPIRVLMGRDGQLALDGEEMAGSALLGAIAKAVGQDPEVRVELKADAKVPGNQVVVLLEQLRAVGLDRISLLTEARLASE